MSVQEIPGLLLDQKTFDNKLIVQSTPRLIGTFYCFSSHGDDPSNMNIVGGGECMK